MEIKRSSWHYKISNFGNPERTYDNLCCYFWRLVGKIFLFLAIIILSSVLIYVYFTDNFWISTTIMILFLLSTFILPPLAIYFIRRMLGKSPEMPYGNIVTAYLAAKKEKVCPLIKYI